MVGSFLLGLERPTLYLSAIGEDASEESRSIHSSSLISVRAAPNRARFHAIPLLWQGHPGDSLSVMSISMRAKQHIAGENDDSPASPQCSMCQVKSYEAPGYEFAPDPWPVLFATCDPIARSTSANCAWCSWYLVSRSGRAYTEYGNDLLRTYSETRASLRPGFSGALLSPFPLEGSAFFEPSRAGFKPTWPGSSPG